jgi:hypothetical protein
MDLMYFGIGLVFFLLTLALVWMCGALEAEGERERP